MAFFTIQEAREAFQRAQRRKPVQKTAAQVLTEEVASVKASDRFDIFLSHSSADAEVIAGVKTILEDQGNSVYVDWIVDKQLDRTNVTPETAEVLRRRMRQSDSLFFATSSSSPSSRWMPWELGYFDGLRQGRVAILPLVSSDGGAFKGQEYLGLYPVVERLRTADKGRRAFVTKGPGTKTYLGLGPFQKGVSSFNRY